MVRGLKMASMSNKQFMKNCIAKKGKVKEFKNTIECSIGNTKIVKQKNSSKIFIKNFPKIK